MLADYLWVCTFNVRPLVLQNMQNGMGKPCSQASNKPQIAMYLSVHLSAPNHADIPWYPPHTTKMPPQNGPTMYRVRLQPLAQSNLQSPRHFDGTITAMRRSARFTSNALKIERFGV